jgi:argininosuccinate lyase
MIRRMVGGMTVRREQMFAAARDGFMNATDLADYLVPRGVPFRVAHAVAGKVVQHCLARSAASKSCRSRNSGSFLLSSARMFLTISRQNHGAAAPLRWRHGAR